MKRDRRNEGDSKSPNWVDKAAIVYCFDPAKNAGMETVDPTLTLDLLWNKTIFPQASLV